MPPDAGRIATQVAAVRAEIAAACARAGRDPSAVSLVAVTKNQDPGVLEALRLAGIRDFGENRIDHLDLMRGAQPMAGDRWHFIGRIQGRQLPAVAQAASALHSLCDPSHIDRFDRACRQAGVRLPVFLQVNTSGEVAKAGLAPADLPAALERARACPGLSVVGLMTMAPELGEKADEATVRASFSALRRLAVTHGLERLSMGMSEDFPIAVEEGATDVRIGSRLFA